MGTNKATIVYPGAETKERTDLVATHRQRWVAFISVKTKDETNGVEYESTCKAFFTDKEIHFVLDDKSIEFGTTSKSDDKILCNYFGGMESFIIDLSLKLTFTKFGILPSSNFFIIDEGISVLDQQRQHNITFLFDFLSTITSNVLLISHIPQIRDL